MKKNLEREYDVWVVDPFGRIPGENMGHLSGLESSKHYASKGKRVLLITSTFSHILKYQRSDKTGFLENEEGIDIIMLKSNSYKKHVGFMRIIWHLYFCLSFIRNFKNWGKPEHISIAFPFPFFDFLIPIIKKKTGAKTVLHFSDLWPEVFELALPKILKPFSKYIFSPFFYMRKKALLSADGITFVSERYQSLISNLDEKIRLKKRTVIHRSLLSLNDFKNLEDLSSFSKKYNKNQLIINYSGTLGFGYDIEGLISVIERIKSSEYSGKVKLFISGAGPYSDFVERKVELIGEEHLEYLKILPYKQLLSLYKQTDLACLPYKPGSPIDFPAKVFDYIVAGTAIIHSIDGELRNLTDSENCGIYYEAGDYESLYLEIVRLVEDESNSLKIMEKNMSRISSKFTIEDTLEKMYEFYQLVGEKSDS